MPMTNAERQRRWRERRAAETESSGPRDPSEDELLAPAVLKTVAALEADGALLPQDAGVAQEAYVLALAIDNAERPASALRWLGPELLKCLEAMGGTPAARARMRPRGERAPQRAPSKLEELRAARANGTGRRA